MTTDPSTGNHVFQLLVVLIDHDLFPFNHRVSLGDLGLALVDDVVLVGDLLIQRVDDFLQSLYARSDVRCFQCVSRYVILYLRHLCFLWRQTQCY